MKQNNDNIKGYLNLECIYSRILVDKNYQETTMNFCNKCEPIFIIKDFIKKILIK